MTVFETPGPVALSVALGAGEVTVAACDETRVGVELVPLRDNEATRQAIAEARVEMTDRGGRHDIVIHVKRGSGFLGRGANVGIRVSCPNGSELTFRSDSADLETTGTLGATEVKAASGDAALDRVGSLKADSASGDVSVREVEGAATVRTASGDVSVRQCAGFLSAALVSGDLVVDDAAAGLTVNTVSGEVAVHAAGGGAIEVRTVSGDVQLAIKPGERLFVDARSVSGTMSSELGIEDIPAGRHDEPGQRPSGADGERRPAPHTRGRRQTVTASDPPSPIASAKRAIA